MVRHRPFTWYDPLPALPSSTPHGPWPPVSKAPSMSGIRSSSQIQQCNKPFQGKCYQKGQRSANKPSKFILLLKKDFPRSALQGPLIYCKRIAVPKLQIQPSAVFMMHCTVVRGKHLKHAKLCMHNEWNRVCKNKQTCGEIHSYCKIDANWCLGSSMLTDCRLFLVKCTKIRVGRKTTTPALPGGNKTSAYITKAH